MDRKKKFYFGKLYFLTFWGILFWSDLYIKKKADCISPITQSSTQMFTFEIGVNLDKVEQHICSDDGEIHTQVLEDVFFYEVFEKVSLKDMPGIIEDYCERHGVGTNGNAYFVWDDEKWIDWRMKHRSSEGLVAFFKKIISTKRVLRVGLAKRVDLVGTEPNMASVF